MNYYDNDVIEIFAFVKRISKYLQGSVVSYRDYAKNQICSFELKTKELDIDSLDLTRFIDDSTRIYDIKVRGLSNEQIKKLKTDEFQKFALESGFYLSGISKKYVYFEKIDDFELDGKVYTSVSEVLEEFAINSDEFLAQCLDKNIPVLKGMYDELEKRKKQVGSKKLNHRGVYESSTFSRVP